MTLEGLLRTTYKVGPGCVAPEGALASPEFRISIQKITPDGVHFIVHAHGMDSETLDFIAIGNRLVAL